MKRIPYTAFRETQQCPACRFPCQASPKPERCPLWIQSTNRIVCPLGIFHNFPTARHVENLKLRQRRTGTGRKAMVGIEVVDRSGEKDIVEVVADYCSCQALTAGTAAEAFTFKYVLDLAILINVAKRRHDFGGRYVHGLYR